MFAGNPVEEGLVQSLARPGGNITGMSHLTSIQNAAKRVELLKEIVPGLSRVAHLQSKAERAIDWDETEKSIARQLGVKVLFRAHANGLCGGLRVHPARAGRRSFGCCKRCKLCQSAPHRGVRVPAPTADHLPGATVGRCWRSRFLWTGPPRLIPALGGICRPHSERRQPRRATD